MRVDGMHDIWIFVARLRLGACFTPHQSKLNRVINIQNTKLGKMVAWQREGERTQTFASTVSKIGRVHTEACWALLFLLKSEQVWCGMWSCHEGSSQWPNPIVLCANCCFAWQNMCTSLNSCSCWPSRVKSKRAGCQDCKNVRGDIFCHVWKSNWNAWQ